MPGMSAATVVEVRLHAMTLADAPQVTSVPAPAPREIRVVDPLIPSLVAVYELAQVTSGVHEYVFVGFDEPVLT